MWEKICEKMQIWLVNLKVIRFSGFIIYWRFGEKWNNYLNRDAIIHAATILELKQTWVVGLRTSRAVLTRACASRRFNLRERRIDLFSGRVIVFCW